MSSEPSHEVTHLLLAWNDGDQSALEKLMPVVHAELHRLARVYMVRESPGHQLQPTALVNEAYLRLVDWKNVEWKNVEWKNRAHFFGVSALLMRRILVDFARRQPRVDGRIAQQVSIDEALGIGDSGNADLVALDDALNTLAEIDERMSKIIELRFFGGLTNEEAAEVLGVSTITVIRDWNKARAWLYRELSKDCVGGRWQDPARSYQGRPGHFRED